MPTRAAIPPIRRRGRRRLLNEPTPDAPASLGWVPISDEITEETPPTAIPALMDFTTDEREALEDDPEEQPTMRIPPAEVHAARAGRPPASARSPASPPRQRPPIIAREWVTPVAAAPQQASLVPWIALGSAYLIGILALALTLRFLYS